MKAPPTGRRIDYLPLADVVPAVRNPKLHDLDAIRDSIARFGFADTPILDERTERLISGHGRVEALAALEADPGAAPPAGVKVVKGAWHVPVVRGWESGDDAEAEAYLLAANRIGERAGWEPVGLASILKDLGEFDPDLVRLAGWDEEEERDALAAILHEGYDGPRGQAPPGEFPSYGEGVDGEYQCPACGHEWKGNPRP